jgi:predicted NodU family carbamoyl transferase
MQQPKRRRADQPAGGGRGRGRRPGAAAAAAAAQAEEGDAPGLQAELLAPQADERSVFMACTHHGAQLGVAVYDRMSNEVGGTLAGSQAGAWQSRA